MELRIFRSRNLAMPVTAYVKKGDEKRMLKAGCDGYIEKLIKQTRIPTGYSDNTFQKELICQCIHRPT